MKDHLYSYPPWGRKAKTVGWYVLVIILMIIGGALLWPQEAENKGTLHIPEVNKEKIHNWKQVHADQVLAEIFRAADEYGVNREDAYFIALCESVLDRYATNPVSGAKGVYQFKDSTWAFIKAPGHPFDFKENIKQFMIWYPLHPEWWECNKNNTPA